MSAWEGSSYQGFGGLMAYGMPPVTDRWEPPFTIPEVQDRDDLVGRLYTPPPAADPKSVIEARIAWLESELKQHAAWTLELEALKRALRAMEPDLGPERTER